MLQIKCQIPYQFQGFPLGFRFKGLWDLHYNFWGPRGQWENCALHCYLSITCTYFQVRALSPTLLSKLMAVDTTIFLSFETVTVMASNSNFYTSYSHQWLGIIFPTTSTSKGYCQCASQRTHRFKYKINVISPSANFLCKDTGILHKGKTW